MPVESAVVKRVQAQAVPGIQCLRTATTVAQPSRRAFLELAARRRQNPQAGRLRHIAARWQGGGELRERDDARVVHVDLAEGDFAIQVERQDVFLTRPICIFPSHNFQG